MTNTIGFSRTDFTQAVKWVLDITDSHDASSSVQMKMDRGMVQFAAVSMKGQRTYRIVGEMSGDDEGSAKAPWEISAAVLRKAVDRLTDDEVKIRINTTNITLSSGVDINVPLLSSTRTRIASKKKLRTIGSLSTSDFFDAVTHLSFITVADSSTPATKCIDFTANDTDDRLVLMATDIYSLSTRSLSYENEDSDTGDDAGETASGKHRFLLPAKDITSMKGQGNIVTISDDDSSVCFNFDNGATALVYKESAQPIEYEELVKRFSEPREGETVFTLNVADFTRMIDTAMMMSETSDEIIITLQPGDDYITVTNRPGSVKGEIPVNGIEGVHDKEIRIRYSYYTLKDILQAASEAELRLHYVSASNDDPVVWDQLVNGERDDTTFLLNAPLKQNAA